MHRSLLLPLRRQAAVPSAEASVFRQAEALLHINTASMEFFSRWSIHSAHWHQEITLCMQETLADALAPQLLQSQIPAVLPSVQRLHQRPAMEIQVSSLRMGPVESLLYCIALMARITRQVIFFRHLLRQLILCMYGTQTDAFKQQ